MADKKGRTGDKETDEILAEMEAEGLEVPAFEGMKKPAEEEDNSEQKVESPELNESKEESEEEESDDEGEEEEDESDEDESADDTADSAADDESGDEEEGDADETGGKKTPTLAEKFRKERKLRKEAQDALATALAAKSNEAFDVEVKKFADANNMNLDTAKGLIELAAKRAGLPKEMVDAIQQSQKQIRNQKYWVDQRKKFDNDFRGNVIPALRSLGAKDDEIQKVYETLNGDQKSPSWAWSKSNKSKSLVQLAIDIRNVSGDRISSESGSKRIRTKSGKAPEEMTGDDIDNMSDEEFDTFSDKLGKSARSVVHRSS